VRVFIPPWLGANLLILIISEHPTLAIRLGPMAESRLYKIAHPAIFRDPSFACLIHMNRTLQRKSPASQPGFASRMP
jgi:hypothetical protein